MTKELSVQIADGYTDEESLDFLVSSRAASRLRESDPTLWGESAKAEASERLGWIPAANQIDEVIELGTKLRAQLSSLEYERVLLCGMGGSSLSPQVMTTESPVPLIAVDSIHPDFIARVCPTDTLLTSVIVVSSKSGGTVETRTQLALCEARLREADVDPTKRIVVITDPGSELEEYAQLRGYRTVLGNPQVGGRYSALTVFGIVPAVLAGVDLGSFSREVQNTLELISYDSPENPAIRIAAALKAAVSKSATAQFITNDIVGLPAWAEQLIAESTGKDGKGLLPIVRSANDVTTTGGIVVALSSPEQSVTNGRADIDVTAPLGAQFMFWQFVTALLCATIGVNPFDQPDVEHTKRAVREMSVSEAMPASLAELAPGVEVTLPLADRASDDTAEFISEWLAATREATYAVVQAFVPERSALLAEFALHTERLTGTPSTVSYGPEYLHSTGQLHKGGRADGIFLNIFQAPTSDIRLPEGDTSLGLLCASMALADQKVLKELGRRVTGLRLTGSRVLEPIIHHLRSMKPL